MHLMLVILFIKKYLFVNNKLYTLTLIEPYVRLIFTQVNSEFDQCAMHNYSYAVYHPRKMV